MPFTAVSITLDSPPNGSDPALTGWFAHAALMRIFRQDNPAAFTQLHTDRGFSSLSLAVLPSPAHLIRLRVVFLTDNASELATSLMTSLLSRRVLRLGKLICPIQAVLPHDDPALRPRSFVDLLNNMGVRWIRFHFLTTTAINQQTPEVRRITRMYPEADDVFRNLWRRWDQLGGPALPPHLQAYLDTADSIIVWDYRLTASSFGTQERWQRGFIGYVEYRCLRSDPEAERALAALARFARYSGVGYQTGRGMGVVKTWLQND